MVLELHLLVILRGDINGHLHESSHLGVVLSVGVVHAQPLVLNQVVFHKVDLCGGEVKLCDDIFLEQALVQHLQRNFGLLDVLLLLVIDIQIRRIEGELTILLISKKRCSPQVTTWV